MEEAICCDICFRTTGHKVAFLCPTDARNRVYEVRLKLGHTLLEHGDLDKEISALLSRDSTDSSSIPPSDGRLRRLDVNDHTAEQKLVEDRMQQIITKAEELRLSIQRARDEMAQKKAQIYRQSRNLEKASNGLEARRRRQLEELEKSIKRETYRWNSCHAMTVQSRRFLCGEAATIYALRRLRGENGTLLDEYAIGGVRIVDLKQLNSAQPRQITAALGHIAQLFGLACTYLSVRPPAEITLPHNEYPLPTIFKVEASYTYTDIPFPGTTAPNSKAVSPSESAEDLRHAKPSRPRPLYVTEALPKLARDDPNAYNSFIEAVCLLAYDIAWVCKSQGVSISSGARSGVDSPSSGAPNTTAAPAPHTFEDITAIGRNLYNLLLGNQPRSVPSQVGTPTVSSDDSGRAAPSLGQYSHGSMHTSLNSAVGSELVKTFKVMTPPRIADQLKKHLMAEVIHAEWELVDEWQDQVPEADDGKGPADRERALSPFSDLGTVAGSGTTSPDETRNIGSPKSGRQESRRRKPLMTGTETVLLGGESFASLQDAAAEPPAEGRRAGTNGWTRVKPRPQ